QIPDSTDTDVYRSGTITREIIDRSGVRTTLGVALRNDRALLGAIFVNRREAHPFSDKEIALLETFAAQAVIAMENARLLTETRESLEQQPATAEVLQVINSSPGDLAPVFNAMLEKAMRLCGFAFGTLWTHDAEQFSLLAAHGVSYLTGHSFRTRSGGNSPLERLAQGERLIHVADVRLTDAYAELPAFRSNVDRNAARTMLAVPLRREGALLGAITAYRQEVRLFTDRQIALLQNFAQQAVIAMENARLIIETREALEQQQAISEILSVINSSPGDLQRVFDIILEKAMSLCGAAFGELHTYDGEHFYAGAMRGVPAAHADFRKTGPTGPGGRATMTGRAAAGENVIHILDLKAEEPYAAGDRQRRSLVDRGGARTALGVALRQDATLFGLMMIYRQEVSPFSDKQIVLLQNFGAQAVIAMDNARLLNEIRQRQAELRVTFDNMGDGVRMFDAEMRLAAWNRNFQEILDLPDAFVATRPTLAEYFHFLAERGEYPADLEAELGRGVAIADHEARFERTRPDGRVIEVRR